MGSSGHLWASQGHKFVKPLTLKNIVSVREQYPGLYEDLLTMQEHINTVTKALGGVQDPIAAGGINISASNGVIDVQIVDKHPQQGEEYFLEYDTQPSFATAHTISLAASRNHRTSTLAGLTTYWRWYKSTKLGSLSERIVYGNPPTAVVPGNTASPAPAIQPSSGSGVSQIPGYGYSGIGNSGAGARGRTQ